MSMSPEELQRRNREAIAEAQRLVEELTLNLEYAADLSQQKRSFFGSIDSTADALKARLSELGCGDPCERN